MTEAGWTDLWSAFKGRFTLEVISPKTGRPKSPTLPEKHRKSSKPGKHIVRPLRRIKKAHDIPTDQSHATRSSYPTGNLPSVRQNGAGRYWPITETLKSFSLIIFWPANCHLDRQASSRPPDQTWWVTWLEARSPLFFSLSNWRGNCVFSSIATKWGCHLRKQQNNKKSLDLDLIVRV